VRSVAPGWKLAGQGAINAVCPGSSSLVAGSQLFFVTDHNSQQRYLVDTGSSFSILPYCYSAPANNPSLQSANNLLLQHQFLLADILGIDFLRHFKLVVDVYVEQLLTLTALAQTFGGNIFTVQLQACLLAAGGLEWESILADFPSISQPFSVATNPAHGVEHATEASVCSTKAKFCRLDLVHLAAAKLEFQKLLDAGIVPRSASCWSSPLHMVQKKCGRWRPCGDFCHLNAATSEDKYPHPNMGDLSPCLDGCTIFFKLDLQKGYYQVSVAAVDIHKTVAIMIMGVLNLFACHSG
jgi:hypothetical protein